MESSENSKPAFVRWRTKHPDAFIKKHEARFFEVCRGYDYLENVFGVSENRPARSRLPSFELDLSKNLYAHVYEFAKTCSEEMGLGAYLAKQFAFILEEKYEIRIVYLNLEELEGLTACSVSESGKYILLNSNGVPWQQNFNMARELFHIITWNPTLFEQISSSPELCEKNEKLADAFAAGLLIPTDRLQQLFATCSSNGKLSLSNVLLMAREFEVSPESLLWQLVDLKCVDRDVVEQVIRDRIFHDLETTLKRNRASKDRLYSWRFVRLAYQANSMGRLSKAKMASYLDVSLIDLDETLAEFGLVEIKDPEFKINLEAGGAV
jgi:Zn-dependent peptidase ImmA (M78 family)